MNLVYWSEITLASYPLKSWLGAFARNYKVPAATASNGSFNSSDLLSQKKKTQRKERNTSQLILQELGWEQLGPRTSPPPPPRPIRDRLDPDVGLTDFSPSRGSAARLPQAQIPECKVGLLGFDKQ